MNGNNLLLSQLVYGTNWGTIRVRVARRWILVSQVNKEAYEMGMQLLDAAVASVRKHVLRQFEPMFEESSVYDITRFNIQDAKESYRVVDDNWVIVLRIDTRVLKVNDEVTEIPRFKFTFVDDDGLVSRLFQIVKLIDLAGILRGISNEFHVTTNSGTNSIKRELHVETEKGTTIIISLWGEQRNLIDESIVDKFEQSPTIVVTSLTVSTFGRAFTFNSTKASTIYLNIESSQLDGVKSRINQTESIKIAYLDHSATQQDAQIQKVECTIAHLISEVRAANSRGKEYVVSATVVKLNTSSPWSYLSCPFCSATVHLDGSQYFCGGCVKNIENPLHRYRIKVDILDPTMSLSVTAFGKEAEVLIGHKVDDLLSVHKSDNGAQKIEQIFQKISGHQALFEFRPKNYEINNPDASLTVRKIKKHPTSIQASDVLTQITPPSEHSSTIDMQSPNNVNAAPSQSDIKGKNKIITEEDCKANKDPPASDLSHNKKGLNRGIVIHDMDNEDSGMNTRATKNRGKKQKN